MQRIARLFLCFVQVRYIDRHTARSCALFSPVRTTTHPRFAPWVLQRFLTHLPPFGVFPEHVLYALLRPEAFICWAAATSQQDP